MDHILIRQMQRMNILGFKWMERLILVLNLLKESYFILRIVSLRYLNTTPSNL
jgi:hypothetical protein